MLCACITKKDTKGSQRERKSASGGGRETEREKLHWNTHTELTEKSRRKNSKRLRDWREAARNSGTHNAVCCTNEWKKDLNIYNQYCTLVRGALWLNLTCEFWTLLLIPTSFVNSCVCCTEQTNYIGNRGATQEKGKWWSPKSQDRSSEKDHSAVTWHVIQGWKHSGGGEGVGVQQAWCGWIYVYMCVWGERGG